MGRIIYRACSNCGGKIGYLLYEDKTKLNTAHLCCDKCFKKCSTCKKAGVGICPVCKEKGVHLH